MTQITRHRVLRIVTHATFVALGITVWLGGVWWLGLCIIVYAIANLTSELLILKQEEVITSLSDRLARQVRNS